MRLSALLALAAALAAAPDGADIMRRSVEALERHDKIARNYTFVQRSETRELDSEGRVKSRKSRTHEIIMLEQSPYQRLIKRNDQPLSPAEERKEQQNLDRSIAERRKETAEQRARRIAEWERKRKEQREMMAEVLDAFDFKLAGEANLEGRPAWILEATPRPGYRPRHSQTRFLPKIKGRIWIDREDLGWVKFEAQVIEPISVGLILARVQPGTRLSLEQTRVNNEAWLPRQVSLTANARVALLKKMRAEVQMDYTAYRKFQADSRIVTTEPLTTP